MLRLTLVSHKLLIVKQSRAEAEGEGKYIKQTGGRGQYGHCLISIKPKDRGTGYEFIDEIRGGAIPQEFITPVDKGVKSHGAWLCGRLPND